MFRLKIFFTGLAGVIIVLGILLWVLINGIWQALLWLIERERRVWRGRAA